MIQAKYRRVYMKVDVRFDSAGREHIRAPVWTDGHKYEIDRVLEV